MKIKLTVVLHIFLIIPSFLYAHDIRDTFTSTISINTPYASGVCNEKVKGRNVTDIKESHDEGKCKEYSNGKILYGTEKDWLRHTKGGFPIRKWGNRNLTRIIYRDFSLAYSNSHNGPLWVMSNPTSFKKFDPKRKGRGAKKFVCDPKQESKSVRFQEDFNNYVGSALYARGHLFPNALARDCIGKTATFVTTNIVPQVGAKFNSKSWRILEECVNERVLYDKENLSILTGVIYPTKRKSCAFPPKYKAKLKSGLTVPCKLYKIIMNRDTKKYHAFLFDNIEYDEKAKTTIEQNRTTITEIQSISGLKFFSSLGRKYPDKSLFCN